jgi:pseudaminic acid biosynthesis-associated methylase
MHNSTAPAQKKRPIKQRAKTPRYVTEQEGFWAGDFGNAYVARNRGAQAVASNLSLFATILARTGRVQSLIEFGANIGLNLQAIKLLLPETELAAVEINSKAVSELRKLANVKVHHQSILDFRPRRRFDLVLIKGVLIHIHPEKLPQVYERLYSSSSRFICLVEYYNPVPVVVSYRGHDNRLFKRDFAGEILKRFPDLQLLDYGFVYHGDPVFPGDDITWFLLEKCPQP